MYRLSETQQDNLKEQISAIINQEIARTIQENQVIYKTRYSRRIL